MLCIAVACVTNKIIEWRDYNVRFYYRFVSWCVYRSSGNVPLQCRIRIPLKFMRLIEEGLYELRIEYQSNIYRIFFCFDEGRIVILFNGFQKKTEKTPKKEIDKAKILRKEYYGSKNK